MATALTSESQGLLRNHLFGASATPFPAGSWLTLHSAQPGLSGASQLGSTRVAVSWSWDSTNKWWRNASPVSVPGISGYVAWVALWHGAGTGNVWFEGQLASPFTMSVAGSVLIPANALRIYAALPDASNKGGLTDYASQYALGHFLGASSYTMPTDWKGRYHSADPTRTGSVSVVASANVSSHPFFFDPLFGSTGQPYWSVADSAGNPLMFGTINNSHTEQAWVATPSGLVPQDVDFSASADYTSGVPGYAPLVYTFSSMRVAFDVVAGVANGDVYSGVISLPESMALSLIPSLKAPVTVLTMSQGLLVSVGSTTQARVTMAMSMDLQIGDSVPAIPMTQHSCLYQTVTTFQTLGRS